MLLPGGNLWIVTSAGDKLYKLFDRIRKDPHLSPLLVNLHFYLSYKLTLQYVLLSYVLCILFLNLKQGISDSPDWIQNKESAATCYKKTLEGVGLKVVECEEKIVKYEFQNMGQCTGKFIENEFQFLTVRDVSNSWFF